MSVVPPKEYLQPTGITGVRKIGRSTFDVEVGSLTTHIGTRFVTGVRDESGDLVRLSGCALFCKTAQEVAYKWENPTPPIKNACHYCGLGPDRCDCEGVRTWAL